MVKDIIVSSEETKPAKGDIDCLEQVFSNLLDNALKHSPSGGEVSIIGRRVNTGSVQITVADSGPGIPPEQVKSGLASASD